MKIQELAIIFVIIILPISLLLSEYTQFQIQTIKLQTEYDAKLTAATYDAIKAFQLNSTNSTTSDLANSKMRDLEASVATFRNSIMTAFELNGYTEDDLNNYIPALVYTLYDGFYIYSPYKNTHGEGNSMYGLKPYINYSCRYVKGETDVVITYALDNYITVQGMIRNEINGNLEYVNKGGYLIDNITVTGDIVEYNTVRIETEQLSEYLGGTINKICPYAKINGVKYYLIEDYFMGMDDCIVYILNGKPIIQYREGDTQFNYWKDLIESNNSAKEYYRKADEFTKWFKSTSLKNLKYSDARSEENKDKKIWEEDNTIIFDFNPSPNNVKENIENELSNFNQHRLEVIRHKIETNLAIAISNYNEYSGAANYNVFQMPELKENEWDNITHNISLISFLQGLHIGGKVYNGYTLVTNSESKEVVLEDNIYILGNDESYHKIGGKGFETGTVYVSAGSYGDAKSAGRLNLDFEKATLISGDNAYQYYPLPYKASYDSVVMQNNVTTYDDIYVYIDGQSFELKQAFYTALGRERASKYNSNRIIE